MNIYAQKGTKVRFLNFNGQEWEREKAATVFDTEREYTIDRIDVGGFSSDVYFEEVAGPWNTVMFLEVGEELPDYIKKARGILVDEPEPPEAKGTYVPEVVVFTHYKSIEAAAEYRNTTVDALKAMWAEDHGLEHIADEDVIDFLTGGDYREVSVQIDGVEAARYGDYYHEKGQEKAEGFVDALQYLYDKVDLSFENVADINY